MWSYWEKEVFEKADLIIVGGGFTGLWTAVHYLRAHPHRNVIILDDQEPASRKNAGFACFGSYTEILRDIQEMGEQKTMELVSMRMEGIEKIRQLAPGIIEFKGGFELLEAYPDKLEEVNALLQPFSAEMFRETNKDFGFHHVPHVVENEKEGQLNPFRLWKHLYQIFVHLGGIFIHDHVVNVEPGKVNTQKRNYHADKVMLATNGYTQRLIPGISVMPGRGMVLITSPVRDLKISGTFHMEEGYYYFRDYEGRVLYGGGRNLAMKDEQTMEEGINDMIRKKLMVDLKEKILPGCDFTIDYEWSGIMGFANTRYPMYGIHDGVFYVAGMGGMGLALAPVMAEKMARELS